MMTHDKATVIFVHLVIGRCGGDEKTRMITQNRQKSNAKNIRLMTECAPRDTLCCSV